ncbi:MAG: AbgT family transporter [Prevotella sp.]|nr:AbgT family transporter [Prevotella sp.]
MNSEKKDKILSIAVVLILASQVLLFLVSWLITAASPEISVHSLLGSEGLRWFFGNFVGNVSTPPLVWIIILAMAFSAIRESMIIDTIFMKRDMWSYRQRFAIKIVAAELVTFVAIIVVLAFIPHAELLSATGRLFPSPFSHSLIPTIGLALVIVAVSFGLLVGVFRSISDVINAMVKGIGKAAPLMLIYIIGAELFFSIGYVFGLDLLN